jgi:pseudolysin
MDDSRPTTMRIVALFFLCSFSIVVQAAVRVPLAHMSFARLQTQIPVSLSVDQPQSASVMPQDFLFLNRHHDTHHVEHIRMQQRYLGFPVFGSYAIFHRSPARLTHAVRMSGAIYDKLDQDLGDCPSRFVADAATILRAYQQKFPPEHIVSHSIQPIVYIDAQNKAYWAYHIQIYLQSEEQLPSQPTMIIAYGTGKILLQWNALNTLQQSVHGLGFGGNRRIGKYQYGKELPALDIIRDEHGICFLENDHIMVVDMQHGIRHPNIPMRFLCEESTPDQTYWTGYAGDGYDQANGSYSVANDAMYFGDIVKKMYQTQYGVEVLHKGKPLKKLIFRIHFSNYFANAFWDGRQMTFGDGDGMLHPLVGLSITAHELSHGFTQYHSGLIYTGQAGGINEAFSDMAAQAVEYYVYGKPSWHIGADVLKGQGALRWFQHPRRDGVSIERAIDYQPGMDVHHSSGVYNRLFYELATHAGWNPQQAFQVMLKANMDYWTPTTNFAEGACGILAASRDLGLSEEDVKDALDEVVIDYGDC